MLLLSVIFTWFAALTPSMAETEAERRVAALEYKLARHERKLEDVEKDVYAISRNQGQTAGVLTREGCPLGFEEYQGTCYFFSSRRADWSKARSSCNSQSPGVYLAEIKSQAESKFIKEKAAHYGESYWIGLTDQDIEGQYTWWHSGDVIDDGDFTDWAPKEPQGGSSVNCVNMAKDQSYKWIVVQCSRSIHYICETKLRY